MAVSSGRHDPLVTLRDHGFAILAADDFDVTERDLVTLRGLFEHKLRYDTWLPQGHDYRWRAYQCLRLDLASMTFTPSWTPLPYFQTKRDNPVAGGVTRTFAFVDPHDPALEVATRIASTVVHLLQLVALLAPWRQHYDVDLHFVRIVAPGKPSPEGPHHDGLVAGSVHLVDRINVTGGCSHVIDSDARGSTHSVTLDEPLDSLLFDDVRLMHSTCDISRCDPTVAGYRDVLLTGIR